MAEIKEIKKKKITQNEIVHFIQEGKRFRNLDLSGLKFGNSDDVEKLNLQGADFRDCILKGTKFINCDISNDKEIVASASGTWKIL